MPGKVRAFAVPFRNTRPGASGAALHDRSEVCQWRDHIQAVEGCPLAPVHVAPLVNIAPGFPGRTSSESETDRRADWSKTATGNPKRSVAGSIPDRRPVLSRVGRPVQNTQFVVDQNGLASPQGNFRDRHVVAVLTQGFPNRLGISPFDL